MGTLSHLMAGFCTPAAGFGALPTVVHVRCVFFALGRTGFTDMGAKFTYISRVSASAGHERNGGIANFSAVPVEPDTVYHHLNVRFTKTGLCAGIATNSAILTGFNTILILLGH